MEPSATEGEVLPGVEVAIGVGIAGTNFSFLRLGSFQRENADAFAPVSFA